MGILNRIKEVIKTIRFSASPRLYGRSSSGAGNGEEISIGSGLTLVGGVLSATGSSTTAWSDVTGKPATFAPSAHTHTSADITDATSDGSESTGTPEKLLKTTSDGQLKIDGLEVFTLGASSWICPSNTGYYIVVTAPTGLAANQGIVWPSRGGIVELQPTGPYANDQLAAGSAYLGNPLYGLLIFSPSAGTTHHNKQVAIVAPAVLTSPLSVTVTPTLLTVSLEVSGYNPISTIAEVAAAINATAIPNNYFRAVVVSFGTSQASTMATTNLTNGSDTPHVSVGSLYYTADGSVKRRMA